MAGARCFGFDKNAKYGERYVKEHACTGKPDSGMHFVCVDLDHDEFWTTLGTLGSHPGLPPPDLIHASPPCQGFTRLMGAAGAGVNPDAMREGALSDGDRLSTLLRRLKQVELFQVAAGNPLVWQIENVPESVRYLATPLTENVGRFTLLLQNHARPCSWGPRDLKIVL